MATKLSLARSSQRLPQDMTDEDNLSLWNGPLIDFVQYFEKNSNCPQYEDITNGNHNKHIVYDFGASFFSAYNSNPVKERFFLGQRSILKQLFAIRILLHYFPRIEGQYDHITKQYQKSTKYYPIKPPLPPTLSQTINSMSQSLFLNYNHIFSPHEFEKINDSRLFKDILTTFEYLHSLNITISYLQRESIILQSLHFSSQHNLSPIPPKQPLTTTTTTPPTTPTAPQYASISSSDFSSLNRRKSNSTSISDPSLRRGSSTISLNDAKLTKNDIFSELFETSFYTNGGFVPEDVKYTQPLDHIWFLWYAYHRMEYSNTLSTHLHRFPGHIEIDPFNPSSPVAIHHEEILRLIQKQKQFSIRILGIDVGQYFDGNFEANIPYQFSTMCEPAVYEVTKVNLNTILTENQAESGVEHTFRGSQIGLYKPANPYQNYNNNDNNNNNNNNNSNINSNHINVVSYYNDEVRTFSTRRNEILELILASSTHEQPDIANLTKDFSLFPLIGCGLAMPLIPTISLANFFPNFDKITGIFDVNEINRNIIGMSGKKYSNYVIQFYLNQSQNFFKYQFLLQQFQHSFQQNGDNYNNFSNFSNFSQNNNSNFPLSVPQNPSNGPLSIPLDFNMISNTSTHDPSQFLSNYYPPSLQNRNSNSSSEFYDSHNNVDKNNEKNNEFQPQQYNAFFTRLITLQYKKQSLYKSYPSQHHSIPVVCKLYNKGILGRRDYIKDYQNIQCLILKHYQIVEFLLIKFDAIFSSYSNFIFLNQDNPKLEHYFHRSRELRRLYCDDGGVNGVNGVNGEITGSISQKNTTIPASTSNNPQISPLSPPTPLTPLPSQIPNISSYFCGNHNIMNNNVGNFGQNQQNHQNQHNNIQINSIDHNSLPDWSLLPPDPLNHSSQQWLLYNLNINKNNFYIFHKPANLIEKNHCEKILNTIYTNLLPQNYKLIFYLKKQCFFMVEEILILQSLLSEPFQFTHTTEYPEINIEILLTDYNDRFIAMNESIEDKLKLEFVDKKKKDGKFSLEKYQKYVEKNGQKVQNASLLSFWSVNTLPNTKESNIGVSLQSLTISQLDETRLTLPHPNDVVDLEKFMLTIKMLTPRQDKWLKVYYPQTWAYVDRPILPILKGGGGIGFGNGKF